MPDTPAVLVPLTVGRRGQRVRRGKGSKGAGEDGYECRGFEGGGGFEGRQGYEAEYYQPARAVGVP